MARVKFIDVDYFNNWTPVQGNVDYKLIKPMIYKAQDLHIQKALGSKLYDKIKDLVVTGQITDEGNEQYKYLLDEHIRQTLAEWTLFELLPFLNHKLTNKSVSKRSSESSVPSEIDEVKWLRNSVRDSAEFYSDRLISYMKEYKVDFPELSESSSCGYDIKPSKGAFFGGIYLGPKSNY